MNTNITSAHSELMERRAQTRAITVSNQRIAEIEGILPKGPYLPCVSMAGRALLAGYPRNIECRHIDIFVTNCTGSCHFDNLQCSQWRKYPPHDNISISVIEAERKWPPFCWRHCIFLAEHCRILTHISTTFILHNKPSLFQVMNRNQTSAIIFLDRNICWSY